MSNDREVLLPLAARTATPAQIKRRNLRFIGLLLTINVTALAGGSIRPEIIVPNNLDSYSVHQYWIAQNVIDAAAFAVTQAYEYLLYPGAPAAGAGNLTEVDGVPLPTQWALQINHADASSITYDVCAHYLG